MDTVAINPIERALRELAATQGRAYFHFREGGEDCCVFGTVAGVDLDAAIIANADGPALVRVPVGALTCVARLDTDGVVRFWETQEVVLI